MTLRFLVPIFAAGALAACRTTQDESTLRIAGGELVAESSRAASATVVLRMENNRPFCTGTLIAPDLVLTAAHCEAKAGQSVGFGATFDPAAPHPEGRTRKIKKVETHPCYAFPGTTGNRYGFDTQLLLLDAPAPTGFGPPVALAPADHAAPIGSEAVSVGFGGTSATSGMDGKLRSAAMEIQTDAAYSPKLVHMTGGPGRILGRSLCFGDSGGPTYVAEGDDLLLLGVNSHLVGDTAQGTCKDGSAIVDVRAHHAWIAQVGAALRGEGAPPPATPELCANPTNDALALPAYNDQLRGKSFCRMGIDDDLTKSKITSRVLTYAPDCPIGGGGGFGGAGGVPVVGGGALELAPSAPTWRFGVSAPAGATAAYFCTPAQVEQGTCATAGVKASRSEPGSGKGRACFEYSLAAGDAGKKGAVFVETAAGLAPVPEGKFELGYLPCPPGGQPAI